MSMTVMTPALIDNLRQIGELLRTGSYRVAHEQLQTLVSAHPDFVEALRLLAGTTLALGDPETAEALLRRALSLAANWPPTLAPLGELLLSHGRIREPESLLQRAAAGPQPYSHAALILARHYNDV